jgi:hypothetical protein
MLRLNPHSPIAAYVKRLRCGECGSSSVMPSERRSRLLNKIAGSDAASKVTPSTPGARSGPLVSPVEFH